MKTNVRTRCAAICIATIYERALRITLQVIGLDAGQRDAAVIDGSLPLHGHDIGGS
jgi:hypothetical protein